MAVGTLVTHFAQPRVKRCSRRSIQ